MTPDTLLPRIQVNAHIYVAEAKVHAQVNIDLPCFGDEKNRHASYIIAC